MSESFIENNSFKFGNVDMWDAWQLRILDVVDILKPRLRARKKQLPLRDGEYDFGAKYYEERNLTLKCIRMSDITRHEQHELAYALQQKSQIRLYDDPEKYYTGRIYDEVELQPIRNGGLQIMLKFRCDPFLIRNSITDVFDGNVYYPNYHGTVNSPTIITIKNTGSVPVSGIRIILQNKRS